MQQKIIKHYGYKHQLAKLVEEMKELEDVILNEPNNELHLQEEMADVLNLLEQIIDHREWCDDIDTIKEYKINRQLKRIEQEVK